MDDDSAQVAINLTKLREEQAALRDKIRRRLASCMCSSCRTRACGIALLLHTYGGLYPLLTANM